MNVCQAFSQGRLPDEHVPGSDLDVDVHSERPRSELLRPGVRQGDSPFLQPPLKIVRESELIAEGTRLPRIGHCMGQQLLPADLPAKGLGIGGQE